MQIISVTDKEFAPYGRVVDVDTSEIVSYLKEKARMPEVGKNLYVRDDKEMHCLRGVKEIRETVFGMGDMEVGYCNGYNSLLNCMEYHACPEVDVAADDLVLLLALQSDSENGVLDSKRVKAFEVKKGEAIILYPYVFHFSPCKMSEEGFRCAVFLSDKTNMELTSKPKDRKLWMVNKWLLAHKDTTQAKEGAYIGIIGDNILVQW